MMSAMPRGRWMLLVGVVMVTLTHPSSGQDTAPDGEASEDGSVYCYKPAWSNVEICAPVPPNNQTAANNGDDIVVSTNGGDGSLSTEAAIAIFSVAMTLFVVFVGAVCCFAIYKFGYRWGQKDGEEHVAHLHGDYEDSLTLRTQFEDVVGFPDLEAQETEETDLYMGNVEDSVEVSESGNAYTADVSCDRQSTASMEYNVQQRVSFDSARVSESDDREAEYSATASCSEERGVEQIRSLLLKKERDGNEADYREEDDLRNQIINENDEDSEVVMMDKHRRRKSLMADSEEGLYSLSVDLQR